ncbi:MAG: DUF748 domain-containing protein [Fibrobacter sp.]|nr:DUF748 domain-containing protein [Fibrobacter sp.]
MKKALKVILIVLAALILLVFAALKIGPSIAKNYIVSHSEELVGRQLSIESISFNPLSFVANVDNFALYEKDGKTPFVAFEKFRINIDPLKIVTRTAAVSEIYLKGLYVRAVQNGDQFNFTDILEHFAADSTADTVAVDTASTDSAAVINATEIANTLPVAISVSNIVFENGNIIYEDEKVGSKFHLEDFSLNIPAVYLSNKSTDVGVSFKFADGGNLAVKVNANMATNDFNVQVDLEQFSLACGKPYMKDFIDFSDFSGLLNTHIQVNGNLNDVMASDVKGLVALDSIVLTETSGQTIGVNHVGVGIARANLNENDFHIDSVIVDGAFAHLDLYKGGKTNIDVLLAPMNKKNDAPETDSSAVKASEPIATANEEKTDSTETSPAPAKKLKAVIDKLLVHNTTVTANDNTITKPFHYTVSGISVNGSNINFDTPCAVNVSAAFPGGGTLAVKYNGAISDLGTMDAYINIKNLALKNFSNYSHHYTGYPLSAGNMSFSSENKIRNFNLDSKNTIDIQKLDVADKDPNSKPEYSVPMKVGLYLLKDKDDNIRFDVPVKGNMKDPQFSIGKIIWKTVMNLIVKVAFTPVKLVESVAGSDESAASQAKESKDKAE